MTKETILAKVMEINAHGTYGTEFLDHHKYQELIEALKADIRDENNKRSGKAKPAKLGKAILAKGQKMQKNSFRTELMAYAYTDDDGIKWVLDGHRIAGFYEDVDLPELPEEDRCRWFNVKKLVDNAYDDEELEVPTVGEIKAGIKIAKAEKKVCVVTLKHGITLNAEYLLDYLEGFTNPRIYPYVNQHDKISDTCPIRIEADNGIGVLLPIKVNEQREPGIYSI